MFAHSVGAKNFIVTDPAKLGADHKADVLHFRDVIEHLTEDDHG
jgi:hypothetical protein